MFSLLTIPNCRKARYPSEQHYASYNAEVVRDPQEMERWLAPLVDAGVDIFDCSQRRFWQPVFEGSPLNLAGWVKRVSGAPTITVGSIGTRPKKCAQDKSIDFYRSTSRSSPDSPSHADLTQ